MCHLGGDGDACPSPVPNRLGPGRSEAATTDGTDAAAATGDRADPGVPSDDQSSFVTYPFIIKELCCLRVWNFGLIDQARRYLQACLVLYRIRGSPSLSEPCAKGMKTELDRGSEPGIHRWAPECKGRSGGFPGTELRWSQETRSNGGHECPLPAGTKLSFLFPVFLKESRELRRSRLPYFSCRHRQRHLGACAAETDLLRKR